MKCSCTPCCSFYCYCSAIKSGLSTTSNFRPKRYLCCSCRKELSLISYFFNTKSIKFCFKQLYLSKRLIHSVEILLITSSTCNYIFSNASTVSIIFTFFILRIYFLSFGLITATLKTVLSYILIVGVC